MVAGQDAGTVYILLATQTWLVFSYGGFCFRRIGIRGEGFGCQRPGGVATRRISRIVGAGPSNCMWRQSLFSFIQSTVLWRSGGGFTYSSSNCRIGIDGSEW
ncbi:hypothetical protein LZ32DRAFT_385230 [Colletotrichum eremochloae]|nr:hypothetical protein LZ32DRAFT_385230 [Colletotrichum eremochloae]